MHAVVDCRQAPLIAEPFLVYEEHSDVAERIDGSLEVEWAYNIIGFIAIPLSAVFVYWHARPVKCLCVAKVYSHH